MCAKSHPPLRDCFLAALAYLIVTWISVWLLRHSLVAAPTALRAIVALVPVIPIGFAIRAVVRLFLFGDELQRRIDLEALAIASVVIGLGSLTLGLLVIAGVIDLTAKSVLIWVFPAQWIAYAFARDFTRRRYR